ncbi:hypothetical protein [Bradyrhizobium commune]|uniref:Uncharacterized protein n=1 Tax=Bradyrhizobium commune TaxID=83627 RepID=A0A7S9D009_9BRAD|nr:hypothetical protein [Bradyrhizobium commune]QPF88691.1 hypothetical protein IC761_19360 [Bradyrhizobium commune]
MTHLAPVDQAFLLLVIVFCLGSCLIRAFWELEQARARRRAPWPGRQTTKRD